MDTHPLGPDVEVAHEADDLAEGQDEKGVVQRRARHTFDDLEDVLLGLDVIRREHRMARWRCDALREPALAFRLLVLAQRLDLGVCELEGLHDAFARHERFRRLL